MRHFRLLGIPLLALAGAPSLSAQTFIPHPPPPAKYIVLDTRGLTTVKQELTLIAMQGYRATYVAPRPGSALWPAGMTIILEKLPEGATAPEYMLAEEKNGSAIHHLLNFGRAGFRYVRNSAFTTKVTISGRIFGLRQFLAKNTSGTTNTTRSRTTFCWN